MVVTGFRLFAKLHSISEVDFLSPPKFDSALMQLPLQNQAMVPRIFCFDRNRRLHFFIDNLDSLVQGTLRFILAGGFRYQVKDTVRQTFIKFDNRAW